MLKQYKVKIFTDSGPKALETKVNDYFEGTGWEIVSTQFQVKASTIHSPGEYLVLITYIN